MLSLLLFNILFTTAIIVVLQRLAADPVIVSDLVYLNDGPKGEDGSPREEKILEVVQQAAWRMLCADDAGVVSTSPGGLARMMDVVDVAWQEFELTVSEKTEAMPLWFDPSTVSNVLWIEATDQRYKLATEFVYLGGAISESADLDIETKRRIGTAWASVRRCSSQIVRSTKRPVVAQDRAILRGDGRSYDVWICHVNYAHSRLRQLAYCSPQATIARHRLSAQGSYRVQTSIVWGSTQENRFRTHRNDDTEVSTWVRRGPCSARWLKAFCFFGAAFISLLPAI